MAIGVYRKIDNADRRFGAHDSYLFLKVQTGTAEEDEEHWLVTEAEAQEFMVRAYRNVEDWTTNKRGTVSRVENKDHKFGELAHYHHVHVKPKGGQSEHWLLTDNDLASLRERAAANAEDIKANEVGWLADLFD